MKKIFITIFGVLLVIPSFASAQTTNPINDQVDQLKDKVASKVAQLNLVEKKGVIGKVTKVGANSFQLEDINGNLVNVTVDELTDYTSDENSSFNFSDVKKDEELWVLGLHNKDSGKILARFINETAIPLFLRGVIIEKDTKNFTVTINSPDKTTYIVDIENITRTLSYDKNDIVEEGFTKIPTMVNAIVVGFENPKEKNRITAGRIITFPDSPKDPDIELTKSEVEPTKSE
jgi:hypothetical protein